MPLARSVPFRISYRSQGSLRASRARPQQWHGRSGRRGYSSQGPGSSQRQSKIDPTWLAGSVAVTVPSTYFLYQSGPTHNPLKHPLPGDHYHGEGHDEEHEESEGEEGGDEAEESAGDDSGKSESSEGQQGGDSSDDDSKEEATDNGYDSSSSPQPSKEETQAIGAGTDTAASAGKRVHNAPESNTVTRKTASGEEAELPWDQKHYLEPGPQGQTRIHMPDSKGGTKTRVESAKGIVQGRAPGQEEGGSIGDVKDGSKSAVAGQVPGQQKGISNTDTKHSTDVMADPEKSKKSEGVPETAKIQGTVDPSRKSV